MLGLGRRGTFCRGAGEDWEVEVVGSAGWNWDQDWD
jgi:hypothetical protein